jgi:hypothetical protein
MLRPDYDRINTVFDLCICRANPLLLHRIFFATFIRSPALLSAIQPFGMPHSISIIYSSFVAAKLRYLGRRIMSGAEIKRRQVPKVNMWTTNDLTNQLKREP